MTWTQHRTAHLDGAAVKVSTLPSELASTLALVDRLAGSPNYRAAGRAGLGVFVLELSGDVANQKKVVTGLRDSLAPGRGSAVVMRASAELRTELDVWGPIGDGLPVMRAVKQQFDPDRILNRGRGPGGL